MALRNRQTLDPARSALVIQDLQNDTITDGGAFAAGGSADHARSQDVVANVIRLADVARRVGMPVIHVWMLQWPDVRGLAINAPLFEALRDTGASRRGTWGAAPAAGLEPQPGREREVARGLSHRQRLASDAGGGARRAWGHPGSLERRAVAAATI